MIVMRTLYRLLLLAGLLCNLSPVAAEVSAALPVIHLQIENISPGETGAQLGREVRRHFPDIEKQYDRYLAQRFSQNTFDTIVAMKLNTMLEKLDSNYSKELYGIANAWSLDNTNQLGDDKLSLAEYQVLNLLSDLGVAPDGSGFAVMGKASVTGTPIVGRNLDWTGQTELHRLQVITVYQNGSQGFVNIGFAGILSVMTGFNEEGLFVAGMSAEPFSPYLFNQAPPDKFSLISFDLRKVLETRHSVKKAGRYLSGKEYTYSHNVLIADQNDVQVLEQSTEGSARMRSWDSRLQPDKKWDKLRQIAVVDCLVLPETPGNCSDTKDNIRWETLRSLAVFDHTTPASTQSIAGVMSNTENYQYEILNKDTLQSVIFQPGQLALQVYHLPPDGQHPQHPGYTDYPGLLPDIAGFDIQFVINILIWVLLLAMLGIAVWQIRKN